MAGQNFTSGSVPVADINFNGGLNSTSGPLSVANNESSDLDNVIFNKFGSILKRSGYAALNTTAITGSPASDGLWWYEYASSGAYASKLVNITNGKFYKMDDLDGTWDDVTGSTTITAGNFCDFENWLNTVYVVNGQNPPFKWTGSGNASTIPALVANTHTFRVSGITTPPAVGDTYTNNGNTYTITSVALSNGAGSLLGTSSGAAEPSGNLTRTAGSGDNTIAFTATYANNTITKAKFIVQFNNYLIMGNVTMGGVAYPSRFVWSELRDDNVWLATSFIDISKDDGQQLINAEVLGDRLVFFKERATYNLAFTGDNDVPFSLAKSNSPVGCIAPQTIQEVENGLVFLSHDGFYYYDGNNSYKISMKINTTLSSYNTLRLSQARATTHKNKQLYMCAMAGSGQTNNNVMVVWDWGLNAFTLFSGMAAAAMATVFVSGLEERPYFADYSGFVYRMDTGVDDYPLNVATAIQAKYYTNWKHYDDIVSEKGVPQVVIYYQTNHAVLTFVYSYDFENNDSYTQTLSIDTSADMYGSAVYGSATYASEGGASMRRDLDGRGRTIRFGFKNYNLGETFQIDGLGSYVHLETNV